MVKLKIKNLEVARSLKTISEECRRHTRYGAHCPLYDEELGGCFVETIASTGVEYLKVTQHGDNEYNIYIG